MKLSRDAFLRFASAFLIAMTIASCSAGKTRLGLLSREIGQEEFFHAVDRRFLGKDVNAEIVTLTKKDNFWSLAKSKGTDVETILGSNPFLKSIYAYPGQRIVLIDRMGVLHLVRRGESLSSIANLYGKPASEIRANNRARPRPGSLIFIPHTHPKVFTPELFKYYSLRSRFIVPIHGWIGAHYGKRQIHPIYKVPKFHKGIDLGGPRGSAIFAAAAGTVRHAGWTEGYGNLVILDHTDGYSTWYGHCAKLFVRNGQKVKQGQIIAKMGNTGASLVPHLHFEVRTNDVPMNPMKVLW
jgi:hypothetical protein